MVNTRQSIKSYSESELHLFIVWQNARPNEKKILDDINKKFRIIKIFEITWSQKAFSQNLSRFYGTKLPPGSSKEKHCGSGPFLLVAVEDLKPSYKERDTSKGKALVNTNLFSSKILHREWTGGGHRVHATNSMRETDHDMMLLLGLNSKEFQDQYGKKPNQEIERVKTDLIGEDGWSTLADFFKAMNACEIYVVLRNFDVLPGDYYMEKHGDIDLLVSSIEETSFVTNSTPVFKEQYRVHHKVKIGGQNVLFDFRYVGDGYYDPRWETQILKTRELKRGFFIPSSINHFYSLLYHGLIHKPEFAQEYRNKLSTIAGRSSFVSSTNAIASDRKALKALANYMFKNGYNVSTPLDASVYFHHQNVAYMQKYLRMKKAISPRHYLRKVKSFL